MLATEGLGLACLPAQPRPPARPDLPLRRGWPPGPGARRGLCRGCAAVRMRTPGWPAAVPAEHEAHVRRGRRRLPSPTPSPSPSADPRRHAGRGRWLAGPSGPPRDAYWPGRSGRPDLAGCSPRSLASDPCHAVQLEPLAPPAVGRGLQRVPAAEHAVVYGYGSRGARLPVLRDRAGPTAGPHRAAGTRWRPARRPAGAGRPASYAALPARCQAATPPWSPSSRNGLAAVWADAVAILRDREAAGRGGLATPRSPRAGGGRQRRSWPARAVRPGRQDPATGPARPPGGLDHAAGLTARPEPLGSTSQRPDIRSARPAGPPEAAGAVEQVLQRVVRRVAEVRLGVDTSQAPAGRQHVARVQVGEQQHLVLGGARQLRQSSRPARATPVELAAGPRVRAHCSQYPRRAVRTRAAGGSTQSPAAARRPRRPALPRQRPAELSAGRAFQQQRRRDRRRGRRAPHRAPAGPQPQPAASCALVVGQPTPGHQVAAGVIPAGRRGPSAARLCRLERRLQGRRSAHQAGDDRPAAVRSRPAVGRAGPGPPPRPARRAARRRGRHRPIITDGRR